ncbi:MAG: ABC transporter permease [Hydrogenibacillus sp.]|nr:ABC transporter permease [Hydrogenibacillus sp.]
MSATNPWPEREERPAWAAGRRRSWAASLLGFVRLWQVLLGLAILLAWEAAVGAGAVDPFFFSRPSAILLRIAQWFGSGFIWPHLWITLEETFLSFAIGALLGIVFGFALARLPFVSKVLEPYIHMFNSMPRVVLAPIFMLWFGLGIWSKVALGVTLVFFIVFFNVYQGVREVSRVVIDNARMLGATERQLLWHVLVPSALSWIFSSLHTSIGFAIVGAVVGEYMGASKGVGYLIAHAEGVFDTTGVFAGMVVLMLIVLVVDQAVHHVERYLLRWKPEERAAES